MYKQFLSSPHLLFQTKVRCFNYKNNGAFVMKIRFLLIGTSLSLIPQTINAQCVATQDCATLGYTETSCSGGSGVKCPFGNFWACFKSESEFCNEYGFTLSCTGTNQTGGVGTPCNGKYNVCSCAFGYAWNATNKICDKASVSCTIGTLYYSDGTCYDEYIDSKTLLGVVIYEKSASQNGWIMTVSPIQTGIKWSTESVDIPGLTNYTSTPTDIQASCTNTDKITAQGNSSTYPAAWAAKNYKPAGTPSGKSWCLPSGGLLNNINNSVNFAKVNAGITTAGGTILGNVYNGAENVWSSSEYNYGYGVWEFEANTSGSFGMYHGDKYAISRASVRPVLAF